MVENIFVNNFKILFPYLLTGSAFLVVTVCSAVFMMSNKIADLIWGHLPHCGVGWPQSCPRMPMDNLRHYWMQNQVLPPSFHWFVDCTGSCWKSIWWAHQDLNLEPTDYESAALTN